MEDLVKVSLQIREHQTDNGTDPLPMLRATKQSLFPL